jgi:hypothetical protein
MHYRAASIAPLAINAARGIDHVGSRWHPIARWRNEMHAGNPLIVSMYEQGRDSLQVGDYNMNKLRQLLPKSMHDRIPSLFPTIIMGLPTSLPSLRPAEASGAWYHAGKVSFADIDPFSREYLEDLFRTNFARLFGWSAERIRTATGADWEYPAQPTDTP